MFSRFRKRNPAANRHEKTRKNTEKAFVFICVCSWLILFTTFVLFASCAKEKQPTSAVPQFEKKYIEPPPQEKIPASTTALRVCADPNNLPFSNERREGFENKIAELLGREMNLPVEYTWWAQRRGFFRNTLRAGLCDVVIGVPNSFELALTTLPYYRSTYVFISRQEKNLDVRSLDAPVLKELKIGVQMIGDDGTNTPPAHALAKRGIINNVVGFTVYGDYKQPNPPARILEAVAKGDVDLAIVWGPLAGFFAEKQKTPLRIVPVSPQIDLPYLPFVYDISMGVRRGEDELKARLEKIITNKSGEIEKILNEYNVPRVSNESAALNKEGK
jgi:quinoprotein dehydrogenase-associated probable ABC transporter substrate-binding protein